MQVGTAGQDSSPVEAACSPFKVKVTNSHAGCAPPGPARRRTCVSKTCMHCHARGRTRPRGKTHHIHHDMQPCLANLRPSAAGKNDAACLPSKGKHEQARVLCHHPLQHHTDTRLQSYPSAAPAHPHPCCRSSSPAAAVWLAWCACSCWLKISTHVSPKATDSHCHASALHAVESRGDCVSSRLYAC
jgi:hypothetical protein